jgi:uncharacterized protein (DUF1697 family)
VTTWAALLRGVNVGGHRRVPMADLRRTVAARGGADVRTYLQSGNVVLASDGGPGQVAHLVRSAVADLAVECDVVVRTGAQLGDLLGRCPWPDRAAAEPQLLHVHFLPEPAEVAVRGAGPQEEVRPDGDVVWVWYGAGAGRSRLQLDGRGAVLTARNWRTVTALAGLAAG